MGGMFWTMLEGDLLQLMKTLEEKIEVIYNRMFRRRLDQRAGYEKNIENGWHYERSPQKVGKDRIKELLEKNFIVSSGYFCTSVRDYHEYYILYKERKHK